MGGVAAELERSVSRVEGLADALFARVGELPVGFLEELGRSAGLVRVVRALLDAGLLEARPEWLGLYSEAVSVIGRGYALALEVLPVGGGSGLESGGVGLDA